MDMTKYVDTRFGAPDELADFMMANALSHSDIGGALLSSGKYVNEVPLTDMDIADHDWLQAHDQLHRQEYELLGLTGITDLATVDMENEQEYHDWMQRHVLIHQQVNLALGIA